MIWALNKLLILYKKMYYILGINFMNILFKTYCRIYQSIFRLAMPLLPYRNPTIFENIEDVSKIVGFL